MCKLSSKLQPWYECKDNILKVTWPTDDVFPADTRKVPDIYKIPVGKLLNISLANGIELALISHVPP